MIDLKTKGYTVIPNFLTQEEINFFLEHYQRIKLEDLLNHPQPISKGLPYSTHYIEKKLDQTMRDSELTVDLIDTTPLYTSTERMDMGWHQDHQNYYFNQQTYNYLNFYIILQKDDPTLSGLSVVPFDVLADMVPDKINKFINSGAKRFEKSGHMTLVFDDDLGEKYNLPFLLEEIQQSPVLYPGDLLLQRGDVIHKTQDVLTKRLALSIRATNSNAPVSLTRLQQGGAWKRDWLKNFEFEKIFTGRDVMPAKDFHENLSLAGKH
jgi:hypothetical protein